MTRLEQLAARGQSIWIDNLSRGLVHDGGMQKLIDEYSVTGVTSNPTIFQKAIAGGSNYDEQIRELGRAVGFRAGSVWHDRRNRFSVHLLVRE